jgi:ElaB/YqjD/DUF883 family membrane-anchored ribosome-binding protein
MPAHPDQKLPQDSTIDEIKALLAEAEDVIAKSGDLAGHEISNVKERLRSALDRSKETAHKALAMAKERAAQADEAIHTHPYVAVGVAAVIGVLVGAMVSRCGSRD